MIHAEAEKSQQQTRENRHCSCFAGSDLITRSWQPFCELGHQKSVFPENEKCTPETESPVLLSIFFATLFNLVVTAWGLYEKTHERTVVEIEKV